MMGVVLDDLEYGFCICGTAQVLFLTKTNVLSRSFDRWCTLNSTFHPLLFELMKLMVI